MGNECPVPEFPSGTSPQDWFGPPPDDPCADDPFICGYPGFPDPNFPLPWPPEQPQQQPPPSPPPPAPIVIPHTGGVFAQGQIGSSGNALLPVAAGAGGGAVVLDIGIGTLCVGTGVCEIIAAGAAVVALGAGAYIIYRRYGDWSGKVKKQIDSRNAEANGGQNACERCGKPVDKIQNQKGVRTPDNQLQRHHKIPLGQDGPSTVDNGEILCPPCHIAEHQ